MKKQKSIASYKYNYFDISVKIENVKRCIGGKGEFEVIKMLTDMGYEEEKDFKWQYPVFEKYVLDIAFPEEKIDIEVDGSSHKYKKQKREDKKRDCLLWQEGWIVLRVKIEEVSTDFFRYLIDETIIGRRAKKI